MGARTLAHQVRTAQQRRFAEISPPVGAVYTISSAAIPPGLFVTERLDGLIRLRDATAKPAYLYFLYNLNGYCHIPSSVCTSGSVVLGREEIQGMHRDRLVTSAGQRA